MGLPSPRLAHHVADAFATCRLEIEKSIRDSIEAQVKVTVAEWGASEDTKKFVKNLKSVAQENDALCREAQVKLDNS